PREFWKVAVYAKEGAGLVSAAFLVSQTDLIRRLTESIEDEMSAAQVADTYQVSVSEIERLTELDFGSLRDADVLVRGGAVSFVPGGRPPRVRLETETQIQVL